MVVKRSLWRRAQSVRWRFTLYTFLLVLLISIVFVTIEGFRSYTNEMTRLDAQIAQIEQSYGPSITSSLWLTDHDLLIRQLEAIALFPYVTRVEVTDDQGTVFAAGSGMVRGLSKRSQSLSYVRRDTEFSVGSMSVYVDEAQLRRGALRAEIVSATGHLVTAVLTAGVVALMFRRLVGRHLERLSVNAQAALSPEAAPDFSLEGRTGRDDELQRLAYAVSTMHRSLVGQIEEREILMREAHHRIKNDLAVVTGLLSLQAHQSDSREVAQALYDASQRVTVISEIYQTTYSGPSMEVVDVSEVAGRIIEGLKTKGVLMSGAVEVEVDNVEVPARLSVAFGVILNELLTNSAKYSKRPDVDPRARVQLSREPSPHRARLTVIDNGPGFPTQVLNGERQGFGLTIVTALVKQHGGTILLENREGARATVFM